MRFKCGDYAYHKAENDSFILGFAAPTRYVVYGVAEAEYLGGNKQELILISNIIHVERWIDAILFRTHAEIAVKDELIKAQQQGMAKVSK